MRTTKCSVMPTGTKVTSAETSGISAWTKTAKVTAILPDGSTKRFFLKVRARFLCFSLYSINRKYSSQRDKALRL